LLRNGSLSLPRAGEGLLEKEIGWHNEALQLLDFIVAGAVEEVGRNDPPPSPLPGKAYIVGSEPIGDWSQYPEHVAAFGAGGWRYVAPIEGMTILDRASGTVAAYGSGGWDKGTVRASRLVIGGQQVVGAQSGAITDPTGGAVVDAEGRAAITAMLSALRHHGLISA
jgi:hypothetical protein